MASSAAPGEVVIEVENQNADEALPEIAPELYKTVLNCNWGGLHDLLESNWEAINTPITHDRGTILHLAIATTEKYYFLRNLVNRASTDVLRRETKDSKDTALHYAASFGNVEAAKLLVQKDKDLLYILNLEKLYPVELAARSNQRRVFRFLFEETKHDDSWVDEDFTYPVSTLAALLVYAGSCDLARDVLKKYPRLANSESLDAISSCPSYFRSGKQYNIWERLVYSAIPAANSSSNEANPPNSPAYNSDDDISPKCSENLIESVWHKLFNLFWPLSAIGFIKRLKAEKKLHNDSIEYVRSLCQMLEPAHNAGPTFEQGARNAAENGIHEIIEEIAKVSPTSLFFKNEEKDPDPMTSMFHIAVKNRHHNIFNLLFQMTSQKDLLLARCTPDRPKNTILHIAANLPSRDRLNRVPVAALQMQRELQWYKAVEKFVPAKIKTYANDDKIMAKDMFMEKHKELVKEGEKWMRETANSCTIAAVLISTVTFAAAITVPGGNKGDTGSPILAEKVAFKVFTISNAIYLFSSLASLVMFLSMLTARYSEEDFLYSLPRRLIIGLLTLFVSICSMVVTSGATIYLVSRLKHSWILLTIAILGSFPVSLFALLQFPLLLDIIASTYGPSIFRKQGNRLLF